MRGGLSRNVGLMLFYSDYMKMENNNTIIEITAYYEDKASHETAKTRWQVDEGSVRGN